MKCVHMTLYEYSVDQVTALATSIDYMLAFRKECTVAGKPELFSDFTCAYEQMKKLGITEDYVEDCFSKSFSTEGDLDSENMLFSDDRNDADRLGIYLHPGLTINNMTYRGYMEGEDIFDTLCTSFRKRPSVCTDEVEYFIEALEDYEQTISAALDEANKEIEQAEIQRRHVQDPNKVDFTVMFYAVLVIVIVWALILCFYTYYRKKNLSNRMKTNIDTAITEYMRLSTSA